MTYPENLAARTKTPYLQIVMYSKNRINLIKVKNRADSGMVNWKLLIFDVAKNTGQKYHESQKLRTRFENF